MCRKAGQELCAAETGPVAVTLLARDGAGSRETRVVRGARVPPGCWFTVATTTHLSRARRRRAAAPARPRRGPGALYGLAKPSAEPALSCILILVSPPCFFAHATVSRPPLGAVPGTAVPGWAVTVTVCSLYTLWRSHTPLRTPLVRDWGRKRRAGRSRPRRGATARLVRRAARPSPVPPGVGMPWCTNALTYL